MTTRALSTRRCRPRPNETTDPTARVAAPRYGTRDGATGGALTQQDALDTLSLAEIEEASGELYRRLATALRSIGERRADDPDAEGRSPRQHAASLAATTELAAAALGALAAGTRGPTERNDRHPTTVAAIMYAAPTIAALLTRLEQDRRMLTSLARTLESRFEEQCDSPWGRLTVRRLLTEVALTEAARCAQELERRGPVA